MLKGEISKLIPDKIYLIYKFKKNMGYWLNFKNPRTFNEKLQWLKIYDRNPKYTLIVDKYEVKKYVSEIIGVQHIIFNLGIWNSFDEIDFTTLPKQFVLKTTHDSGGVVICKDKNTLDIAETRNIINRSLSNNFYYSGREWPYKDVKPRIIAERYIGENIYDYKVFCFNGEIDSIMVCTDREKGHPNFYFYDREWNRLYYQHDNLEMCDDVPRPDNLNDILKVAERLSADFYHVRVDLYCVAGKVYFGELTLYDSSGFDKDITYETDMMWGNKLKLPIF